MKKSLLTLFLLPGLFSCTSADHVDDSPVLASVQNSTLTLETALREIPEIVLAQDTLSAVLSYTEQWVDSEVRVKEAERIGLSNTPEVRDRLIRLRKQLLQDALKDVILNEHEDELEVTREEAQNYYQAHREKFTLEERYVRFRHLTTRTRTEADNAKRDLLRGVSWEDVADEYSVNSQAQLRKSEQFWPISMATGDNRLLKQYLNVIGLREISPIQYFRGQYHFVQLLEERPAGDHPDLEWLIPQITEWLKIEKARRITNTYVRNLYLESEASNEISKASVSDVSQYLNNLSN